MLCLEEENGWQSGIRGNRNDLWTWGPSEWIQLKMRGNLWKCQNTKVFPLWTAEGEYFAFYKVMFKQILLPQQPVGCKNWPTVKEENFCDMNLVPFVPCLTKGSEGDLLPFSQKAVQIPTSYLTSFLLHFFQQLPQERSATRGLKFSSSAWTWAATSSSLFLLP